MNLWDGFRTVIGQAENGSLLPDRLVGSGHPLSVSRDRIRYAPGTVTALTRSADAAGVLVVGGLLTLLTWVVTPIWVGGALLFPLVLLAPLALAPAFVARGYFVRASSLRDRNRERRRRTTLRRVERALPKRPQVRAFECRPPRAARAWGRARSARDRRSRERARRSRVRRRAGPSGPRRRGRGGRRRGRGRARRDGRRGVSPRVRVRQAGGARGVRRVRTPPRRHPRRVGRVAGSGTYATAWLVAAATLGAGYTLAGPFVPLVVGVALVFVVHVAAHGLYGRGAATALEVVDAGDEDG